MAEGFGNLLEVFKAIPAGKRISFLITFSIVVGGFIALIVYTNRPDYQVLFSDLDSMEASKITEKLQENRIKYQFRDGERTIMVPADMVHQLRLDMASEGLLPKGGSVGFEIFDNMAFGTTEFELNIRYQQALQGELARTIREFDSIENAKVHIVTAGDSLFAEDEVPATASVVVRLRPGRTLDPKQLQGIINLVSGSVKRLKPENVSVVDMEGGILTKGNGKNGVGNISSDQFEYQRRLAETYEKQIETLLQPVVGINKVKAKVTVDVDFKRVNTREENYDPDSQVIYSEERNKETETDGNRIAQGSPDLLNSGSQTGSEVSGTTSTISEAEHSIINYRINRVNREIIDESGEIQRLTASVIVDGLYEMGTDDEGNTVRVFKQRDRRQMKTFEDIVKNAIGFSEDRGDQVTVRDVAFNLDKDIMGEKIPAAGSVEWMDYLKKGSKPILNIFMVALFFLIAIKPFKKWLNQTSELVSARALPQGNIKEDFSSTGEMQERQNEKLRLLEATKENPDIAADIIKTWLNEVT